MLLIHTEPPPLELDSSGVIRVGKTRVTLDIVVDAYNDGLTAEEIVQQYDVLRLADVYETIGYVLNHRDEVEAYMAVQQARAEQARAEDEARFDTRALRARLLARRNAQDAQE